jgi:3-hydroxyacyl-[acyl-carrier-protein] dehydratase
MDYAYDSDFVSRKLPQKYPMLMVDRVLEYQQGRHIICLKNVTQNEEFFMGHFPERKIMPGVLIGEALAQTCALLGILDLEHKTNASDCAAPDSPADEKPEVAFLASVNIKFMKPVFPGDQLLLNARCSKVFEGLKAFEVEAVVDKQVVCKGVISTTRRGQNKNG